jgi:2-polyprenyl-6-methoxyphenol hydroxylase-like FAD-dependent oxidoreductase
VTLASGSRGLVVGAGIAGLAAARALARAGFAQEVIERAPVSPDAGTGITCPGTRVARPRPEQRMTLPPRAALSAMSTVGPVRDNGARRL